MTTTAANAATSNLTYPRITAMNLKNLADPFAPEDIEWRVQQAGKTGQGKLFCMVLCYVTNRAIMQRLDDVCGPENWRNEFLPGPHGGVICGLSIRCNGEWVTKWDGADNTQVESVKGGLSDSMKRSAVQWGIGRYLYKLEATFAETSTEKVPGWERGVLPKDKGGDRFWWQPPRLPSWALPAVTPKADIDACLAAVDDAETVEQLRILFDDAKAGGYLGHVAEYIKSRKHKLEEVQHETV